jgi:hypothetical protein
MIKSGINANCVDSRDDFLAKEQLSAEPATDRIDDCHHAKLK